MGTIYTALLCANDYIEQASITPIKKKAQGEA